MSVESPPSRPQDVVLHIGCRKTGTSSIQYFLRDNREQLLDHGLLYPLTPGRARHVRLGLFAKSDDELQGSIEWHRQRWRRPHRFRTAFRRKLLAEIERSAAPTVLFSDEALYGCSKPAMQRLRRFTDELSGNVRLVVYLRRQDDHLISAYQQEVKTGEVRRLAEWAQDDMSETYDYHARLTTWDRLVEPTEVVVRRFEPEHFTEGSLFQDFLDAARIEAKLADLRQVPNRNDSLDAENVELLRLLNLYRVESEGAKVGLVDNRDVVGQLSEASTGPVLTLPARTLDGLMSRWEESNRAVARQFLDDESGLLFRTDRKTHNTTTEQRLDPARIDHFVTLLRLPDEWHGPLHRLAEREAKAG